MFLHSNFDITTKTKMPLTISKGIKNYKKQLKKYAKYINSAFFFSIAN